MSPTARNIALFPWIKFFQNLLFWQAIWFLYFQETLSAAEAILLYAVYDLATTILEVPSGYISDRFGRKLSLVLSALCGVLGMLAVLTGQSFLIFAVAQGLLGASIAFASGTDSAILYESLAAEGRAEETDAQELRAWRFYFAALTISAIIGGIMAYGDPVLPFATSAIAFGAMLVLTALLSEPPRPTTPITEADRFRSIFSAFRNPVLIWMFAASILFYGYSHLPFIFGQPFILTTLEGWGLSAEAPIVSGVISAIITSVSLAATLIAPALRQWLGLPLLVMTAFAIQILIPAVLAMSASVLAIAILVLRSVPGALTRPFILARIQPLLSDDSRATYLSLQALVGRLLFAGSLLLAASNTTAASEMPAGDIQRILGWYASVGLGFLVMLAITATRVQIDPVAKAPATE